jgi:hypothetical protein
MEVRRHQEQQAQAKAAARRAAERAKGSSPSQSQSQSHPGVAEEEQALFLEIAGAAIAQADADGTPTYPLRRAVHAALHPTPLQASVLKSQQKKKPTDTETGAARTSSSGNRTAGVPKEKKKTDGTDSSQPAAPSSG